MKGNKSKNRIGRIMILSLMLIFTASMLCQPAFGQTEKSAKENGLIIEVSENETYVLWQEDIHKNFGKKSSHIDENTYVKFVPKKAGKYHFIVEISDVSDVYLQEKPLTPKINNLLSDGDSDNYFKLGGPTIGNRDLNSFFDGSDIDESYGGDYSSFILTKNSFKRYLRANIPYYYQVDLSMCYDDAPVQIKVVYEGEVTKDQFLTEKIEASKANIGKLESKKTGVKITMNSGCPYKTEGFNIYRSKSKSGSYKKIATTKNKTYIDKTAKNNTKYYYKIKAYRTINGEKVYTAWESGNGSSLAGDRITYKRPK